MKRLLIAMLLVGVIISSSVGLATASTEGQEPVAPSHEQNEAEETETQTETEEEHDQEDRSVVAQVDSRVRVNSYHYNATKGAMIVTVSNTGERYSTLTITEVVNTKDGGSSTFGIEQFQLASGETVTVEVSAERIDGKAGVMVTTEESISEGKGTLLNEQRDLSLLQGGATWTDVRSGVLAAILASSLFVLLGAWYYLARSHLGVEEADLDPSGPSLGGGGGE